MQAKYVHHQTGNDFWFELLAPNGQKLLKSKFYSSYISMMSGIESCKRNCGTEIVEKYSPKMKDASCLEYLLGLLESGELFTILYNSNHCIGVSDKGVFEKDSNAFKRDLINGFCLGGSDRYLKLHEHYAYDQIVETFGLSEKHAVILKTYYEQQQKAVSA